MAKTDPYQTALDTRLNRNIALKIMLPKLAADPATKDRFLRGAHVAAQLAAAHKLGLVHRLLAKNPEDRLQSADEVLALVRRIALQVAEKERGGTRLGESSDDGWRNTLAEIPVTEIVPTVPVEAAELRRNKPPSNNRSTEVELAKRRLLGIGLTGNEHYRTGAENVAKCLA